MTKHNSRSRSSRLPRILSGVAFAVAIAVAYVPGAAAGCIPTLVEYVSPAGTAIPLLIKCGGTNFTAIDDNVGTCSGETIDTMKTWTSLAQAALLAGKQLNIYTKTCDTRTNIITGIDLLSN